MLPPLFLVAMLWYFAPESTLSAGGVDPLLWEWLAMGNGHGGAALRHCGCRIGLHVFFYLHASTTYY